MNRGLSSHKAWRVCFAVVPVPILLFVAIATLVLGTDCPAGELRRFYGYSACL